MGVSDYSAAGSNSSSSEIKGLYPVKTFINKSFAEMKSAGELITQASKLGD